MARKTAGLSDLGANAFASPSEASTEIERSNSYISSDDHTHRLYSDQGEPNLMHLLEPVHPGCPLQIVMQAADQCIC